MENETCVRVIRTMQQPYPRIEFFRPVPRANRKESIGQGSLAYNLNNLIGRGKTFLRHRQEY